MLKDVRWKDVKGKQCLLVVNTVFTHVSIKAYAFWHFMVKYVNEKYP